MFERGSKRQQNISIITWSCIKHYYIDLYLLNVSGIDKSNHAIGDSQSTAQECVEKGNE